MGRSVEAGFVSSLPQNASQHRRRRSLPVRAGNEDAEKAPFRMFKSFDEHAYLQRFTPRGPKSRWSQINRDKVEHLVNKGRMKPAGQRHQTD